MKNLLLSTVFAVSSASIAIAGAPGSIAAVAPVAMATPAASVDWSGFYAGGLVSFDAGGFDGYTNGVLTSPISFANSTSYGGFIGYNKQVNNLVFGGELSYTTGDIADARQINSYTDRTDLKARVGYSFGKAMAYGVVGYSWAELNSVFPSSGLNYGVGVDYMLGQHMFVGAEYLTRNISGVSSIFRADGSLNSATLRVGYKF